MRANFIIQHENAPEKATLSTQISSIIRKNPFTMAQVAVAYATVSGTRKLLGMFPNNAPSQSLWLIGLSDMITHPDALLLLSDLAGSDVRIAQTQKSGTRFHPKVFQFGHDTIEMTLIGSANLTMAAFTHNVECLSQLTAETDADRQAHTNLWNELWKTGNPLTPAILDDYRVKFDIAEEVRKHAAKKLGKMLKNAALPTPAKTQEVLASDCATLDPAYARICWIEVGKNTLMGRELEFKAELAKFFGLKPAGEAARNFDFALSNGTTTNLRMKYQSDNHMWRLQMNPTVPEIIDGLRPKLANGKLGRSPFVAVFTKTNAQNIFELEFILETSTQYEDLKKYSEKTGTLGHTTARQYGWCNPQ